MVCSDLKLENKLSGKDQDGKWVDVYQLCLNYYGHCSCSGKDIEECLQTIPAKDVEDSLTVISAVRFNFCAATSGMKSGFDKFKNSLHVLSSRE